LLALAEPSTARRLSATSLAKSIRRWTGQVAAPRSARERVDVVDLELAGVGLFERHPPAGVRLY
jgi:hypothetical protein